MRKKMPKFIYKVKRGFGKRSPAILTATGILSMGTAAFLAAKETPKAIRLIEEREMELQELEEELTPKEKVKVAWKCYVPALTAGIFGAACLIGAHSVHARRNAAIATAYKLSETALTEYKEAEKIRGNTNRTKQYHYYWTRKSALLRWCVWKSL